MIARAGRWSATHSRTRALGLHQIFPASDATDSSTIDIIAIHGLGTESPRTWEYKKDGGELVNWLADSNMLPAAIQKVRIFTYEWDANYFKEAPVQTLLGHADTLLSHVTQRPGPVKPPLIFIASCFGGLILAQAVLRAAEAGSAYGQILHAIVGVVFLATPFRGSAAANEAQWQVIVSGVMQQQTSKELIDDLDEHDKRLRQLTQRFAEVASRESVQLPLYCFYELRKTKLLRRFISSQSAHLFSKWFPMSHKILVTENSACLDTVPRQGLDATHSGMNKFDGPESSNFKLVQKVISNFVDNASPVLGKRKRAPSKYHWSVPFGRNRDFVGRNEIMDWLLDRVPPSMERDDCQRTAITGLGGAGKTQIALEVAFRVRNHDPDCSIFWASAVDATSFENAYREIGRELQVPGIDENEADVKTIVQNALGQEAYGRWLLIIDNADDRELLFATMALCDYLPFSPKGSILFTTRNNEAAAELDIPKRNIIMTAGMADEEAMEMLQTNLENYQTKDSEGTIALLDMLTRLPLAIKQASAYMAKTGMSTTKYLQHCQASDKRLIKLLGEENEYRGRYKGVSNAVATTWLVSFNHILRDQPLAAVMLKMMCFLVEKDIPVSMLIREHDELEADEAIGTLKAYAFITLRENSISFDIHRLVQLAMRNWLEENGQHEMWIKKTTDMLADVFPCPTPANRDIWRRYLPHSMNAVNFQDGIKERDDLRLLCRVSDCYTMLGSSELEKLQRRILTLSKDLFEEEDPDRLDCLDRLAWALTVKKNYKEAEQIYRQTLSQREKTLEAEHPDILTGMTNFADVLMLQGRHHEAEQLHRETLKLRRKVLGNEHVDTLSSMKNLFRALQWQDKYEEGEPLHRETQELVEKVLNEEDPRRVDFLTDLFNMLCKQGKYQEAEETCRQEVALAEKIWGTRQHASMLFSINNLASILWKQEKYEEAEQLHQETLELGEKVWGREHPITLCTMNDIAVRWGIQRKYKEAERLCRQAVELNEQVLGREHHQTLKSNRTLASILLRQRKVEEGEKICRETLKLREKVSGREHRDTLSVANFLARILRHQGKYEEAEQFESSKRTDAR